MVGAGGGVLVGMGVDELGVPILPLVVLLLLEYRPWVLLPRHLRSDPRVLPLRPRKIFRLLFMSSLIIGEVGMLVGAGVGEMVGAGVLGCWSAWESTNAALRSTAPRSAASAAAVRRSGPSWATPGASITGGAVVESLGSS